MTSQRPYDDLVAWMIPAAVVEKHLRPKLYSWLPREYSRLMQQCWGHAASQRPTAAEVALQLQRLLELAPKDGCAYKFNLKILLGFQSVHYSFNVTHPFFIANMKPP